MNSKVSQGDGDSEPCRILRRFKATRIRKGQGKRSPQVFPQPVRGGCIPQGSVRHVLNRVLKKAEIPPIYPYQPPKAIKELLDDCSGKYVHELTGRKPKKQLKLICFYVAGLA